MYMYMYVMLGHPCHPYIRAFVIIICIHMYTQLFKNNSINLSTDKNTLRCRLRNAILFNAALLIVFVAQHSLMACKCVKQMMNYFGVSAISRLIYVFATCSTLQVSVYSRTSDNGHSDKRTTSLQWTIKLLAPCH